MHDSQKNDTTQNQAPINEKPAAAAPITPTDDTNSTPFIEVATPENNPETDPRSPDFNAAKWATATAGAADHLKETAAKQARTVKKKAKEALAAESAAYMKQYEEAQQKQTDGMREAQRREYARMLDGDKSELYKNTSFGEVLKNTVTFGDLIKNHVLEYNTFYESVGSSFFRLMDYSAIISGTMPKLMNYISDISKALSETIQEEIAEKERFFSSDEWPRLKDAFPDITEDDASLLLFTGLTGPLLENLTAFKEKIADYERANDIKLKFSDLYELPGIDPQDVLLEQFLNEITQTAEQEIHEKQEQQPEKADKKKKLEAIKGGGTPEKYTMTNTVLTNALRALDGKGEIIGAGPLYLPVLNKGRKNEISVLVNATWENADISEINGKPYPEFDNCVNNAICTLYMERTLKKELPIITLPDIYRTMTHKSKDDGISPRELEAVRKSFEKHWKNLFVELDATDEAIKRGYIEAGANFKIKGFLISAVEGEYQRGGHSVTGYLLLSEPLLLQYARMNNQYFTIPSSLLNIKKIDSKGKITTVSVSENETRISVKSYIMRRILIMRSDEEKSRNAYRQNEYRRNRYPDQYTKKPLGSFRKQSRNILFDSVFEAAEITDKNRKTDARNYVLTVLENWKVANYQNTGSGFIKDYKINKKGRSIDSITIIL